MTDAKREGEHLAQANRHIAEAHKYITEQKKLIEKLERDGHEIDVAVSMLRALENALDTFEIDHEAIERSGITDPAAIQQDVFIWWYTSCGSLRFVVPQ